MSGGSKDYHRADFGEFWNGGAMDYEFSVPPGAEFEAGCRGRWLLGVGAGCVGFGNFYGVYFLDYGRTVEYWYIYSG